LAGLVERLHLRRDERRKAELEARALGEGLTPAEREEWANLQARLAAAKGASPGGDPEAKPW
ncbi:MAG TPA: hypothetical protein PLD37_04320, partial [Usitatibacteraceae bacterium]|nr:hypothetical protein [Usitatibacteraceae bacterium]